MRSLRLLLFVQLWIFRVVGQPAVGQISFSQNTLTNNSNLFITANMGRSLLDDLHRVAPGRPNDSLFKHNSSGYQFTLLVDHHLIYKSDIWTPVQAVKNPATVLHQPLLNYQ